MNRPQRTVLQRKIDKKRSLFAVKWHSVSMAIVPEDVRPFYPGHCFHRLVPGNDPAVAINREGRIRQEINNFCQKVAIQLTIP